MRRYSGEDEAYFDKEQEAQQDMLVEHAVEAAARGENVEQLLDVMLASVSGAQKDKVKGKFIAALKKRGLRVPGKDADVPSRNALDRLRNALTITAREAYERVMRLV